MLSWFLLFFLHLSPFFTNKHGLFSSRSYTISQTSVIIQREMFIIKSYFLVLQRVDDKKNTISVYTWTVDLSMWLYAPPTQPPIGSSYHVTYVGMRRSFSYAIVAIVACSHKFQILNKILILPISCSAIMNFVRPLF